MTASASFFFNLISILGVDDEYEMGCSGNHEMAMIARQNLLMSKICIV